MILDYLVLALKNIRKRGIRSWLTMLGIFIGIAAVVSLISLGDGLQSAITGQFSTLGADKLVFMNAETGFGPPGSTAVVKLNDHDLRLIQRVPGVQMAVGRLIRVGQMEYNDIIEYEYIANIPSENDEMKLVYEDLKVDTETGRLLRSEDRKKVVLGNGFTGDDFDKPIKVGNMITIQGTDFQVVGILKKASSFTINDAILMPHNDMEEIFNISDELDTITVQVANKDVSETVANAIRQRFRQDRNEKPGEEDFTVQTPQQSLQTINTILDIINIVVAGIAAISLIVGGIGITNTMYTAVLERTKEIGVMKAVGAQNRDIMGIFLIESSLLGSVGGIVGALLGLGFAYSVGFLINSAFSGLPFAVTLSLPLVFSAVAFSLFVGTIAGLVPAYQASRMKPVEALRS